MFIIELLFIQSVLQLTVHMNEFFPLTIEINYIHFN